MRDAFPTCLVYWFYRHSRLKGRQKHAGGFGDYIDVYDIQQAVEDGATVRIYYESRLAKIELSESDRKVLG